MDFTLKQYEKLMISLKDKNYIFLSFKKYLQNIDKIKKNDLIVILRHDVDDKPKNSLKMARLENSLGIIGTYYLEQYLVVGTK